MLLTSMNVIKGSLLSLCLFYILLNHVALGMGPIEERAMQIQRSCIARSNSLLRQAETLCKQFDSGKFIILF